MGDIYMTKGTGTKIMRLMICGMVAFMILIGYVLWQSYAGRSDLVTSQRKGCERGKLDRADNAKGWRIAQDRSLSQSQPWFASRYEELASGLEKRSRINCTKAFPKAGFLP